SKLSFLLFLGVGFMAVVYSQPFRLKNRMFVLKNVFLLKNLLIGFSWGLLVFIGAGEISSNATVYLFFFAVIQVFIGSAVRDVSDISSDSANGVKSLPVVFGVNNAIL